MVLERMLHVVFILLVFFLMTVLAVSVSAQDTPPEATPGSSFAWDHLRMVEQAITHFEASIDGAEPPVDVQPMIRADNDTTFYWPVPALTTGMHNIRVRSCRADDVCSAYGDTFEFFMDVFLPPHALRVVRTPSDLIPWVLPSQ